jgi:hypothetical protein
MNANIRDDAKKVLVVDEKKDFGTAAVTSTTYRLRLERERAMKLAAEASCSANELCTKAGDVILNGGVIISRARCPCQHAIYCDTGCQKAAWLGHKEFCKEKRKELLDIAAYEEEDRRKKILAADAVAATLLREEEDEDDDDDE